VLDETWKPDDAWRGMKEGAVVMAPYNKATPDNVKAAADKMIAGWKDGSYDVFAGPISDESGKERVAKGERRKDADLAVIDWYVKGVQS
jgi:simple sugar transport system substrate-binding protein